MVNEPAVRVCSLSKRYRIGARRAPYRTLREALSGLATAPLKRVAAILDGGAPSGQADSLWALRDVSFEVPQAEVLGVIGRNGAGKSTLLKILSRITEPTEGRVEVRGRLVSLLEVGTGFHPELTGRDNIYLNGAILGMRRAEIARKFEQIVDFAGVERFLDTPVKHYSSGMYVRLAFAVAAHLEPEILVIDEVLAVGDAEFQRKCLGKMGEVAKSGRTILFVSHNLSAVSSLCTRALHLDHGRLVFQGPTPEVVERYRAGDAQRETVSLADRLDRAGTGSVRILKLLIQAEERGAPIACGGRLVVEIEYEAKAGTLKNPRFILGIYDPLNVPIYRLDTEMAPHFPDQLPGAGRLRCLTGPFNVTPGPCYVNVAALSCGEIGDHVTQAATFEVNPGSFFPGGRMFERRDTLCLLEHEWQPGGT